MKKLIPPESGRLVDRREFIRTGAAAAGLAATFPLVAAAQSDAPRKVDVWVFHGRDKRKLMEACLEVIQQNGGFGRNVRTLALKVNAAWARTPEQGANTHPALVDRFLQGCREFGIREIVMPEHSVAPAVRTFKMSGILDAARKNRAELIDLKRHRDHFTDVRIPKGKRLQSARVAKDFLEADAVVNMPVAKHHGGAGLTIAMKNWMGAVEDRRYWHRNDLHQCITDFSTFMKPTWTIVDATRIMRDHGPQGPARNLERKDLLILSRDQIAADAVAATLFFDDPGKVRYIRLAGEHGVGVTDLRAMNIHRIEVQA